MKRLTYLLFRLLFFIHSTLLLAQTDTPKVLVIGLDGLRPDALALANTPTLDQLFSNATYSLESLLPLNGAATSSAPGWTTVLTGVWHDQHGVINNLVVNPAVPTFFERVEAEDTSFYTAVVTAFEDIITNIIDSADYKFHPQTTAFAYALRDDSVMMAAIEQLQNFDPDLLFVHLGSIDKVGHDVLGQGHTFSPNSAGYIQEIENTDARVDSILQALYARPNYAEEDWLIVVTTDHGGIQNLHGNCSREERTIFVAFSGDCMENTQLEFTQNLLCDSINLGETVFLDGQDDYVLVEEFGEEDYSAGMTIECWLRPQKGWLPDYADPFFALASISFSNGLNKMHLGYDLATQRFYYFDLTLFQKIYTTNSFLEDQWYHLAVTIDASQNMNLYVNGILEASAAGASAATSSAGNKLSFGNRFTSQNIPFEFQEGQFAEIRLWNKNLASVNLNNWSCEGILNAHPDFPNLVGHWNFENPTGANVPDLSGNANTAVIIDNGNPAQNPVWITESPGNLFTKIENYNGVLSLVDIAPTILEHFNITPDWSWNFDGKAQISKEGCVWKDIPYTNYFRQNTGWNAGDATISLVLPDSSVLWFFGDSYIDVFDDSDNTLPCLFQVNNCFTRQYPSDLSKMDPYIDTTQTGLNRTFFKTTLSDTTLFWPGKGFVFGDTVYTFHYRFNKSNLAYMGTYIAKMTLPNLELIEMVQLEAMNNILFGRALYLDSLNNQLYIYGNKSNGFVFVPYLARTAPDNLFGDWEFYTGNGWNLDANLATAISSFDVSPSFSVVKYQNQFLLISQQNGFTVCGLGRDIYMYESPTPEGPYTNQRTLYTLEDQYNSQYMRTYNAQAHTMYLEQDELLISYNVNDICPSQCQNVFTDRRHADTYRPKFIRVDLQCLFAPIQSHIDTTICPGEVLNLNGITYAQSGSFSDTLQSFSCQDSILTINLTVLNPIETFIDSILCPSENIMVNGILYDESNTSGTEIMTSYQGCDSTIFVNLNFYSWNGGMVMPCYGQNDFCTQAESINCGSTIISSTAVSNSEAGLFCNLDLGTAPGLWYQIIGTGGDITISTCIDLLPTAFDTRIAIFTGDCNNLICLSANDDACGNAQQSELTFASEFGRSYYIYLTGTAQESGDFELKTTCDCPLDLILDETSGLLSGEISATNSITLKGNAQVIAGDTLLLSAPNIIIDPAFEVQLSGVLETQSNACSGF